MPDPAPPPVALAATTGQIIRDIALGLIGLATVYISYLGTQNHTKIESVQAVQQEAVEAATEVKQKTAEVKKDLDTTRAALKSKSEDDMERDRILLYGNWKYLSENAVTTKDKEKAADAKDLFDAFEKKHPKK